MVRYKLIAISKLLDHGYNVFTPLHNHYDYDYIIEYANTLQCCKVLPVHYVRNSPCVRLLYGTPPKLRDITITQVLCCVREATKQVWLIPFSEVCDNTLISLKSRYDEFLLSSLSLNEDTDKKSVFSEIAKDIGNKIKHE